MIWTRDSSVAPPVGTLIQDVLPAELLWLPQLKAGP